MTNKYPEKWKETCYIKFGCPEVSYLLFNDLTPEPVRSPLGNSQTPHQVSWEQEYTHFNMVLDIYLNLIRFQFSTLNRSDRVYWFGAN